MMEVVTGLRFIRGLLCADTEQLMSAVTGVYQDAGPREAQFPFVTIAYQDGEDVLTLDGVHIMSPLSYIVKVVGQGGSFAPLAVLTDRIKWLLHRKTGTAGNGEVYECVQTAPIAYREDTEAGLTYCHLGGLYELVIKG